MNFSHTTRVRFDDVDAAGIVFYPRVFRYVHDGIEDWFEQRGVDFGWMKKHKFGTPIVHAEADFRHPLQYGDRIQIDYRLRLGSGSLTFKARGHTGDELAFEVEERRATVDLETFSSIPVPEVLRSRLSSSN